MSKWKRCSRCRQKRYLYDGEALCGRCKEITRQKESGFCTAELWHGPGHQSSTFCRHLIAGHPMSYGRKLHSARYGSFGQLAEWFGPKKFTGALDQPPDDPVY